MTSPQARALPALNMPLSRLLALALFVPALFGMLYLWQQHAPSQPPDPTPELVILQLNDTYRLDAVRDARRRERGGLGRVVALVKQLKEQNKNVLVLHSGDFLAPSLESKHFGGAQMVAGLNYMQDLAPLYVVPGNHEFDEDGPEVIVDALKRSRFKWVLSNLERNNPGLNLELARHTSGSVVVPFGKLRVGIFALTLAAAHSGKDRDYAPLADDYLAIAEGEIGRLEGEGADLIIGLTHLDMPDDLKLARLRQKHPRFLWVAGGHEHYWQREAPSAETALVTKGDSNARTIWKVAVVMKGGRAELHEERVDVDEALKPDEKFQREVVEYYRSKLLQERPHLARVITEVKDTCYNGSEENIREEQSNWGSFIADSMRRAYRNVPADIAVFNAGSIRIDDNFCDEVSFEHLERSFAYAAPVAYVKLSGKYFKEDILEHSVAGKRGDGRFLQVSGVRFSFDREQPDGQRVLEVKVQTGKGWEPLREDKMYVVAAPQYLFDCGDGYDFRKHVAAYIPQGPDARTLTYEALAGSGSTKRPKTADDKDRIIGIPKYAAASPQRQGKWISPAEAEKICR